MEVYILPEGEKEISTALTQGLLCSNLIHFSFIQIISQAESTLDRNYGSINARAHTLTHTSLTLGAGALTLWVSWEEISIINIYKVEYSQCPTNGDDEGMDFKC